MNRMSRPRVRIPEHLLQALLEVAAVEAKKSEVLLSPRIAPNAGCRGTQTHSVSTTRCRGQGEHGCLDEREFRSVRRQRLTNHGHTETGSPTMT